ncbi:MAG: phosphoribosylanthranilate isomerase [Gammaproteobacteria bacterium]|jgi:phosphoribosylanthranilate isomerase
MAVILGTQHCLQMNLSTGYICMRAVQEMRQYRALTTGRAMEYRTRVKFCGITRLDDALAAVRLGVDALGFVFYEPSPRYISPAKANAIIERLPPFISIVGLFVDMDTDSLAASLTETRIDIVQFHGSETAQQCEQGSARAYVKALRMAPGIDIAAQAARYSRAQAILVDNYDEKMMGGTGSAFDWKRLPPNIQKPVILAGGLSPSNVGDAIRTTRPYAVDVSSGIESQYGIKDLAKMREFMNEVDKVGH